MTEAVNGEVAPLSAHPAVIATTIAVGGIPITSGEGRMGTNSETARIGFMPSCPVTGMIQTIAATMIQGGIVVRSSPCAAKRAAGR